MITVVTNDKSQLKWALKKGWIYCKHMCVFPRFEWGVERLSHKELRYSQTFRVSETRDLNNSSIFCHLYFLVFLNLLNSYLLSQFPTYGGEGGYNYLWSSHVILTPRKGGPKFVSPRGEISFIQLGQLSNQSTMVKKVRYYRGQIWVTCLPLNKRKWPGSDLARSWKL